MSAGYLSLLIKPSVNETIQVNIERHETWVTTTFSDGTETSNWPHPDDETYVRVAEDCGFSHSQLMDYCWEHEVLHTLLPLRFFGRPGHVSWCAAHGIRANLAGAMAEERLIYYVQRYIYEPETYPCPDPQWEDLRKETVRLLGDLRNRGENHVG